MRIYKNGKISHRERDKIGHSDALVDHNGYDRLKQNMCSFLDTNGQREKRVHTDRFI